MGSTYAAIGPSPRPPAAQWIRPKYRFGFAGRKRSQHCEESFLLIYLLRQ